MASKTNASFHLFVSYCGENKNEVYKLFNQLEIEGFKLWIDKNEMTHGNVDQLMQKGIDDSELFMCCASSAYCRSDNCMAEFNYAIGMKKKVIYVLFEKFEGDEDRMKKLHKIAFRLSRQKYYKNENIDGIVWAIKNLVISILFNN